MPFHFPASVPEIPVSHIGKAIEYYVKALGFQFDWGNDDGGIAGISQGDARLFLTNADFRSYYGNGEKVMIWINLSSRAEVDELFARWRAAGARIISEPEDKPWRLREFRIEDLDGNQFRVFYDFSSDLPHQA